MRRLLFVAASTVVAISLGACSSGSSSSGSGNLSGKTPTEILNAASGAASAAGSAHYELTERAGTQSQTIIGDASTTEGHQAISTGKVHVQVVLVRGVAYVQGDAGGLGAALGLASQAAISYANKWIAVQSGDTPYSSIVQAVTLNGTISQLRPTGSLHLTGSAVIDGHAALGVAGGLPGQPQAGVTGSTTLFVASSPPTVPLKFTIVATDKAQHLSDVALFTKWGRPLHLSAPAGSVPFSSIPKH